MSSPIPHGLHRSRWPARIGQLIEIACLFALIAVFVTVIYGFWLRAIWAHGYFLAVGVAIVGALVILVGMAQQAIAARDVATWRDMAEWQIRAARDRIAPGAVPLDPAAQADVDPDSAAYYEVLVGALVRKAEADEDAANHAR